ncbi:hypothetical protein SBA2_890014 [Acidobacteriia bacterium SbA2]|nr:hypothetical protein SBA2_890014 [Acidobacteriia bacterium SbA2]
MRIGVRPGKEEEHGETWFIEKGGHHLGGLYGGGDCCARTDLYHAA